MRTRAVGRGRRAAAVVALATAGVMTTAGLPTAGAEPLPAGRILLVGGAKTGTGKLYTQVGSGAAVGMEAGYSPLRPSQTIGFGLSWALTWTYFWSGSAPITGKLRMVEFDLGARLRLVVGPRRSTVLFVGGGAEVARTNEPVFDVSTRSYLGPWGAAGIEGRLGPLLVTSSLRLGILQDGVGTVGLMVGVGLAR